MDGPSPLRPAAGWRWMLWLLALAIWTVGLLMPDPLGRSGELEGISSSYAVAKLSHLTAYAVLAAGCAWLPAPAGRRWWLLVVLVVHGGLSEWLQQFVPTRTASLADVGIDLAGVALGCALTWRAWRE